MIATQPAEYFLQTRPEMLPLIPTEARCILDIGCGAGLFGMSIKQRQQAEVWGMEYNPEAASQAERGLDRVLIGDAIIHIQEVPDTYFDAIVCNDILEHLPDPFTFIDILKTKLAPKGVLVVSLPNVRYANNLWNLLFGKDWKYEDSGILDRTHLRFFTKKSIERLFREQHRGNFVF